MYSQITANEYEQGTTANEYEQGTTGQPAVTEHRP